MITIIIMITIMITSSPTIKISKKVEDEKDTATTKTIATRLRPYLLSSPLFPEAAFLPTLDGVDEAEVKELVLLLLLLLLLRTTSKHRDPFRPPRMGDDSCDATATATAIASKEGEGEDTGEVVHPSVPLVLPQLIEQIASEPVPLATTSSIIPPSSLRLAMT
jgi:hypothetical protein